jgi:putative ABC transport system permease protein
VRDAVRAFDPSLPLSQVRPLEEAVGVVRAQPRFLTLLLGLFAALALGLAAVGIFSVMTYAVAQRTNEFGVRMALGADPRDVFGLVLRGGGALVLAGALLGGAGAMALRHVLKGQVFGIGEPAPLAWGAALLTLLLVTLAACLAPARRATRVDPNVALRYE